MTIDMNHRLTWIITTAAAFLVLLSCGGKSAEKKSMTPEETVSAFYAAVSQGDFTSAKELCDTVSMAEYISINETNWERMKQADSSLAAIAAAILAGVEIEFGSIEKSENKRIVHYTIDAMGGRKKEKVATVRKEEGEWKVEKITDAI